MAREAAAAAAVAWGRPQGREREREQEREEAHRRELEDEIYRAWQEAEALQQRQHEVTGHGSWEATKPAPPADSGGAGGGVGHAADSGGSPARAGAARPRALRPPACVQGHDGPPSEDDASKAAKKAANRGVPPLPEHLQWAYFSPGSKQLWLRCKACAGYLGLLMFNEQLKVNESDFGECLHFDDDIIKRRYLSELQRVAQRG